MEIDVRATDDVRVSSIRYANHNCVIDAMDSTSCMIRDPDGDTILVYRDTVPDLIRALVKYMEIVG